MALIGIWFNINLVSILLNKFISWTVDFRILYLERFRKFDLSSQAESLSREKFIITISRKFISWNFALNLNSTFCLFFYIENSFIFTKVVSNNSFIRESFSHEILRFLQIAKVDLKNLANFWARENFLRINNFVLRIFSLSSVTVLAWIDFFKISRILSNSPRSIFI